MPRLAAFPKAWMQALCVDGSLSLEAWIEMATALDVDGLEFYSGFLDLRQRSDWSRHRKLVEDRGLSVPMLCCSSDFTHPDAEHRRQEVEKELGWIDMAAALGCTTCRVLSGQRRPEVSRDEGLGYAAGCIEECLPSAEAAGITLVIENHYKDDFWQYPEFAQAMDVFCDLVDRIDSPHFGVNYDPSNTLLAGEDPLELLRRVRHRVVSMHASDRFLAEGTIEDLRREENSVGYARRLSHGEIGKGLNDYDAIFSELRAVGFDGWISIEDGVDGMDQMKRSANFLRGKMRRFWPEQ